MFIVNTHAQLKADAHHKSKILYALAFLCDLKQHLRSETASGAYQRKKKNVLRLKSINVIRALTVNILFLSLRVNNALSLSCFIQGLLMLLQNLPTIHWGNEEVGLLLAEAYRLKYMFADAPRHYKR